MKIIVRRYRVVWINEKGEQSPSVVIFGDPELAGKWAEEQIANEKLQQARGEIDKTHTDYGLKPEDFVIYGTWPRVEEGGALYHLDKAGPVDEVEDGMAPTSVLLGEPGPVDPEVPA